MQRISGGLRQNNHQHLSTCGMFIVSNISAVSKGGATIPNMTTRMRSTSSSAVSLFHHRHFSSSSSNQDNDGAGATDGPLPLFLVLDSKTNNDLTTSTVRRPKLLLPPLAVTAATTTATSVTTIEDVLDAVNRHYSAEKDDSNEQQQQQFVGGMGESDPGVWFITTTGATNNNENDNDDPLDHAEFVTESILAVKEHRHGVPFGLYTTGIVDSNNDDMVMSCLQRLKTLHVGLYAASPPDYSKATGLAMPAAQVAFGRACSFLAMVGENKGKLTLQVGLSKNLNSSAAKAGRDLAMSLGAQQVHYY